MMTVSDRAKRVKPFLVMEILEAAQALEREGKDVVHLEIGEPDFDTPKPLCDAARQALDAQDTHYTHSMGKRELREAICRWYERRYGVRCSCDQVIVTSGTSPALLLALAALCDQGDEVIISNPYYPCYPNFCRVLGIRVKLVPTSESEGFLLDPDRVRRAIAPRTRAIIVNSPSNPTGQILDTDRLKALCELGVFVVSDEIYHGLTYGEEATTALRFTDRAVVVNGFSKLFAMTGWRLGYAIAPKRLVRAMQKMQQNLFISASSFGQTAAVAALARCDEFI
ncbi:MAG TPA: aminotransferase class I/II-fold pyridoxal phosphate-dependent enzyme, partial [Proteobacteria bacterium]|nr:aminotransferase class I/II-fold pyridoxal phosphate-dependent enzyme [Pseudomonadota bacterium]